MTMIRDVPKEELIEKIQSSKNKTAVLLSYGIHRRDCRQMNILNEFIIKNQVNTEHFKWGVSEKALKIIFAESRSFKEVGLKIGKVNLGFPMTTKWYKNLKDFAIQNSISIENFDSALGKMYMPIRFSDDEVFCLNSNVSQQTLKKRYLGKRKKIYCCDICSIKIWNGNSITFALDHIDGNSSNNSLSNLRLLCPNCHSQTSTFAGKNSKSNGREKRFTERVKIALQRVVETEKRKVGTVKKNAVSVSQSAEKIKHQIEEKIQKIESRKNIILCSGVDFSKFGRNQELALLLGISSQKAGLWLKLHMPKQYLMLKHSGVKLSDIPPPTISPPASSPYQADLRKIE